MKAISLRGVDDELSAALRAQAKRENQSVNAAILRLLREATGLERARHRRVYTDLDHLAGTWGEAERREFEESVAAFDEIDEELWR